MDGFGNRLVEARKRKGYNQKQFAELLEITPTRLNYWEKDKREPDFFMFAKIVSLLEVDANEMLGLENQDFDHTLITAYRAHPEAQASVNKLLDIEAPPTDALAADLSRELNQVTHRMRNIPKEQLIKSKAP